MSETSALSDFRALYESDSTSQELSDSLVRATLRQVVRKINKYSPRPNQRVDISITQGATFVLLPTNFQAATAAELYRLKTGNVLAASQFANITLDILSNKTVFLPVTNGRFTAEGRVRVRRSPDALDCDQQESIEIFQNDDGRWALWLDTDSAAARTETKFSYTAFHELTDAVGQTPAKDTISGDLRDVLFDETMHLGLLTQGRQYAREGKTAEADRLFEQAKHYGQALRTIAPLGGAA